MITPAEIEAVARAACNEMGLDADARGVIMEPESALMMDQSISMRWLTTGYPGSKPAWQWFTTQAESAIAFHRAIEAVKGAGK